MLYLNQQVQLSSGDYHLAGNLVRNERVWRPTWWSKPVHQNDQKLKGDYGADSDTCEVDDNDDNEEDFSKSNISMHVIGGRSLSSKMTRN